MAAGGPGVRSAFSWNTGGWFVAQLGSTVWLLILGLLLFAKDAPAAWVCVAGFGLLNAWGLHAVNGRGASAPPAPGALVSTHVPYSLIAVVPALMVLFFWLERRARGSRG